MTQVVPQFNTVIHARHRLQICSILGGVDALSFATVQETLQVSDYVVSKHVRVLVDAGYVTTRKQRHGGRSHTWLSLTETGRQSLESHLVELRRITALGSADGSAP